MQISRRGFLGGLAALVAAPAVVQATNIMPVRSLLPDYPVLWGDGMHDDRLGLQTLIDGKPVLFHGRVMHQPDGAVMLPQGNFYVPRGIVHSNRQIHLAQNNTSVEKLYITTDSEPAMQVTGWNNSISHCVFSHRDLNDGSRALAPSEALLSTSRWPSL